MFRGFFPVYKFPVTECIVYFYTRRHAIKVLVKETSSSSKIFMRPALDSTSVSFEGILNIKIYHLRRIRDTKTYSTLPIGLRFGSKRYHGSTKIMVAYVILKKRVHLLSIKKYVLKILTLMCLEIKGYCKTFSAFGRFNGAFSSKLQHNC